ncbi:MAG: alpha/beta fold hydrolase [Planctomycetota bacterium]|nr:MAG: alpha/beta fold hydrolase [Planctomycetota bacterium]
MPIAALREGAVNYVSQGFGPVVLLIHGFPLDHTMWREQIEELSTTFRVIAVDLPGFGKSFVPVGDLTIERLADWIAEFLDVTGIQEPVTVGGLSMGGCVALQFALRFPSRLSRLILCDCRAMADSTEVQKTRHETADRALREGPGFLAEAMPARLFAARTRESQPTVVKNTQDVIRQTAPEGAAGGSRALANRADVRGRLNEIRCPTLLIVGAEDMISTVDEMRTMAEALSAGTLVEIPGAGHMAPLEVPEIVNAAIQNWLAASH